MAAVRVSRAPHGALIALALAAMAAPSLAQGTYQRGQNVAPAYEGWEQDADGSRWFLFGYMNRNWEEELDVPVGPDNEISPGAADQGQPTHFLPRRNRFVFRVAVPEGFGEEDELVWTLTTYGKTEQAFATLRQDYFVDNLVKASEQGAIGAGTSDPTIRANKPPSLRVEGAAKREVRVGEPLELVARAEDDDVPPTRSRRRLSALQRSRDGEGGETSVLWTPPYQVTVGSATGLRVSWFVYRGTGEVTFDPPQAKVWEDTRTGANSPWAPWWQTPETPADGKWTATATFTAPGTYVLRCLASDGALGVDRDVTVTVVP